MTSSVTTRTKYTETYFARQMLRGLRLAWQKHDWRVAVPVLRSGSLNLLHTAIGRRARHRYYCPCCQESSYAFVHLGNQRRMTWNSMCPNCGSRSRHRALVLLLPRIMGAPDSVIHFAPESTLREVIVGSLPSCRYQTTDFQMKNVDYPGEDIQNLSFSNECADVIICNHVIEHVPDDDAAFRELARILRPAGVAYITLPGDWSQETIGFADPTVHNGHYRDYGWDVVQQMRRHFSTVETITFDSIGAAPYGLRYGIAQDDRLFVCRK